MAIVITGIIAGMVAVFIRSPVEGYMDAARRAELTDIADTAVRRMARDIRLALPNSVRNPSDGSDSCIEFMPTKIGARYRAAPDGATGLGDPLEFSALDDKFDMLWSNAALPADSQIAAGDVVVVYNDGSASGNAYTGSNAIQVASVAEPRTARRSPSSASARRRLSIASRCRANHRAAAFRSFRRDRTSWPTVVTAGN